MCGIAAHFRPDGAATPLDLALIAHRGPDAAGEWLSPDACFWLGNTRLAILDLSPCGAQPMIDPATGNVLVMNGEIYNHHALRAEMPEVNWRGTSDTETVLQGYAHWGRDLLVRLKGMFAFVIYDRAQEELFLARDRLGIKPLYFAPDADGIRFGSETRLFPDKMQVSSETIAGYLEWGACPEQRLLFSGIETLPAGHGMIVRRNGAREQWRWWPAQKALHSVPVSAPQKVRRLLETAVEEHLLSDVPVASFLSGGTDSSIITALAAQKLERKLKTFSVGFDLAEFDETAIALEVARRFGTQHERIQLTEEEVIASVTEAVAHLDLPSVDAINTYIVSKAVAQRGVKVALSGLGGDELFGGYPSFRDAPRLKLLARFPRTLRRLVGGERLADVPNEEGIAQLAQWRRRFFTAAMLRKAGLPNEPTPLSEPVELPDDFARISWAELTGYMRRMLLRDADQMSMAVSLELRVPFLDHELVEYSLGLSVTEKRRYRGTKGLLVEACRDLLPSAVYERPKRGFSLPMEEWMTGPLVGFVEEGLRETVARTLLPESFVTKARGDFRAGRLHWSRLWSMVVLGHFVRQRASCENPALHSFA